MNKEKDIFERMLEGGIIRYEDPQFPQITEIVNETMKLSQKLNASTDSSEVRRWLSKIIGKKVEESTTVFIPFHTNFGRFINIGENVFMAGKGNSKSLLVYSFTSNCLFPVLCRQSKPLLIARASGSCYLLEGGLFVEAYFTSTAPVSIKILKNCFAALGFVSIASNAFCKVLGGLFLSAVKNSFTSVIPQ